jgi:hypothetical protein
VSLSATSVITDGIASYETGVDMGRRLMAGLDGMAPSAVVYYATVNHDQAAVLGGLRAAIPSGTGIVGCSTQGVMSLGRVTEEGYAAGALALAGLPASTAHVEAIQLDTYAKGVALGAALRAGLSEPAKAVVLLWDPLCGADMDRLLAGLHAQVQCPIIGGAASHTHSAMIKTLQGHGDRVFSHGAVAMALAGDNCFELGCSAGTSPIGVEMTVTRAEGTRVFELDGRPALDVWTEITSSSLPSSDHAARSARAGLAIGIPVGPPEAGEYLVRAPFGIDTERKAVVIQASLSTGSTVMLHHRTVPVLLDGTAAMARDLRTRLGDRTVRAVLGFECGARTKPFLGMENTLRENLSLQATLGGTTWLGMLAWGEVFSTAGKPAFHNYAYPLLVLAD